MDDPATQLQKALQNIATLERLASARPVDADAVRTWARGHFRALLTLEQAFRRVTKETRAAAPSPPPQSAAETEVLRSLADVTAADQSDSLGVALGALLQLTGAQRGFVALREPDGLLSFPVARAFGSLDISAPEAELSRTILEAALRGGSSLRVDDARADSRFGAQGSVQALALRAVVVVPLAARGRPFGVLYLDNPARAAAFDDAACRAAESFASVVGPILARDLELSSLRFDRDLRLEDLRERYKLQALIGRSKVMVDVMELVSRVAPRDATVLVTGETGTGKELVAQAIHANSARASGPLVAVNGGALPAELVESELFGHERGAFTGAHTARVGRFEAARGGTLFLDEIGELPPSVQVKLLRVLESGTFERVGASKPLRADVRIVAATNRSLDAEVAAGRFRADLLFRLKVIEIRLPPLRERRGDVPLLVQHFVDRFCRDHAARARRIHPATMEALDAYAWPGNVRELRNVLERAVILAPADELTLDLLPPEIAGSAPGLPENHGLKQAVRAFKKRFVERAFEACGDDHAAAAARLGVHPKYLYQLIRDLENEE